MASGMARGYASGMQPPASAVRGTVEAGPIRPTVIAGDSRPNTRTLAGATVEALREGDVVATATTDHAGRYELTVRPGTYLIRATAKGLHSREPGRTVTVSPGETLAITFVLDTGIRCRWDHQQAVCPLGARCPRVRHQAAPGKAHSGHIESSSGQD